MKTKLSLYIHIPFCVQKCRYCDFLSGPADETSRQNYLDCLCQEIESRADDFRNSEVITIYIGGGTPSVLEAEQIAKVLGVVKSKYTLVPEAEVTIEINPGTVDEYKLRAYYASGINRLSIGLQSPNDEELATLGRIHSLEDFQRTYELAREVGFDNINVDLMSAIPGQTLEAYVRNLEYVIGIRPEHISSYSFQLEEGTWFYNHQDEYEWPSEDLDREMYEVTRQMLGDAGYFRYEISNYSLAGYESRHNSVYWRRGDYLGLGLGASSLISNVRMKNVDSMDRYLGGDTVDNIEEIDLRAQMEEFMFLGLRLMEGVSPERFEQLFGLSINEVYGTTIEQLIADGLLTDDQNIMLTNRGIDISNYVLSKFLLD